MPEASPEEAPASRMKQVYASANAKGTRVYERGQFWVDSRDPASRTGATIGWFSRYRQADGQLYAVLLTAYFFLTIIPLLLLASTYVYNDPDQVANRLDNRLGLSTETAQLVHSVLAGTGNNKFSAIVLAVINLFFFGVGFGRVLQLAHSRSWGIDLRANALVDQGLYFGILVALVFMTFFYVLQTKELRDAPSWISWVLDLGWLALVVGFFTWMPWLLLHRAVSARDVFPGALFTVICFLLLRLISGLLFANWLDWYSKSYGAIGIVMAIFFWLVLFSTVMVLGAALSPALAHRRDLRRSKVEGATAS
jgi:uncharacterized BrkB/YihY/UPF0761 family membrane protein